MSISLKWVTFDQVFFNEISKVFNKILRNCTKAGSEASYELNKLNKDRPRALGPAAVAMTICRKSAKK